MTPEEKGKIIELKEKGHSYKEIADRLGLSKSTVSSVINRSKEKAIQNKCACCGSPIKPSKTGRKRKYCSDKCRKMWWRNHGGHRINIEAECLCCGKPIVSHVRKGRRFCSQDCYQRFRGGGRDE